MTSLAICDQTSHTLLEKWAQIRHGGLSLLHLNSRIGGGAHKLIRIFQNEVALECITWHARFLPEERNQHILPKILDGLWKNIRQSENKSAQILKALHQKLPDCATQEDQQQLQSLIDSLRASRMSDGEQIIMSDNRPIRALITLAQVITNKFPVLIILEDMHNTHAMTTYAWLDALLEKLPIAVRLMVLVTTQSESLSFQAFPEGLRHICAKHSFETITPKPWSSTDIQSLNIPVSSPALLWWTEGIPGRILEIKDQKNLQQYADAQLSFASSQEEAILCAASLYGERFPIRLIAKACNITMEQITEILPTIELLQPRESQPNREDEFWGFRTVTAQLKMRAHALNLPQAEKTILFYLHNEGVRDVGLLVRLLDPLAILSSETQLRNVHNILHSAESDLSWLHLADTCISHSLDWPQNLLSTSLIAGMRYLYTSDIERAKRMFVWSLQWAAQKNMPRTAMEAIRIHARYFDRNGDPTTALVSWQDAIKIAQETEDSLYLVGLHLDLAEHHIYNSNDREAQITLQLIRSLPMSPPHGMKFLQMLGRIDVRAQRYRSAQEQFQKARDIALQEGFLRTATDLALLRIQALLEADELEDATQLHKDIRSECAPFEERETLWQNLKKEIIAKTEELR